MFFKKQFGCLSLVLLVQFISSNFVERCDLDVIQVTIRSPLSKEQKLIKLAKDSIGFAGASLCQQETINYWRCDNCFSQTYGTIVTKFINHQTLNLFAFVGYNTEMKVIVVSFRGARDDHDYINYKYIMNYNFTTLDDEKNIQVHEGFHDLYSNMSCATLKELKRLIGLHPKYTVLLTGHSMGGALASLGAYSLSVNRMLPISKIRLITYGQPKVGNKQYAEYMNQVLEHSYRITGENDVVPLLPTIGMGYYHSGNELYIHKNKTIFCKKEIYETDENCYHEQRNKLVYESGGKLNITPAHRIFWENTTLKCIF